MDPGEIRAKKISQGRQDHQDKEDIGQKAESSRSKIRRFLEGSMKKGDASENVDHSVFRPSS